MAGLDAYGFFIETLQNIKAELEAYQKANINSQLNVSASSPVGQLNSIISAKLRELWELAEAVYAAFYPDSANGVSLDNIASLTGTLRLSAIEATITMPINTGASFSAAIGTLVCYPVSNSNWLFSNVEAVSSPGGGNTDVLFEATVAGARFIGSGSTWEKASAVVGWNTVGPNALDVDSGRDVETDHELRIRREDELDAIGKATVESIRSDILQVTGVTSAIILENMTGLWASGLAPHSKRAIILGGTDEDVAFGIFDTKGAGIDTNGRITITVYDSQGIGHDIKFDRPTTREVYLEIDIAVVTGEDPTDGDDAVKAALAAYGDTLRIGEDVILSQFKSEAFKISGVVDITAMRAGFAISPSGTVNLPINVDQLALFDTSRIEVDATYIISAP